MSDVDAAAAAEAAAQDAWEKEMEMMMDQRDNRSRSRSFIETPSTPVQTDMPRTQSLGPLGFRSRATSRARGAQDYDDDEKYDQDATDEERDIARQAAATTKLYLAGSAPVDLEAIALQDAMHASSGNRNTGQHAEAGALSAKALDLLSQGLALRTRDSDERRSMTEEELEEKKMAEEEAIKLQKEREIPPSMEENIEASPPRKKKGTLGKAFSGFKSKMFGGGSKRQAAAAAAAAVSGNRGSITSAIGTSRPPGPLVARRASASQMAEVKDAEGEVKRKPHKIKLLLLGDSGVGKTSLMRVFSGDEFSESMLATAGVDFKLRNMKLEDEYDVALQIWDTAGQERFHRITSTYYKGANGIILVYDVSDKRGFDNVGYWMKNIQQHSPTNMPAMLLVGNKIDLPTRVVNTDEGQSAADQYSCRYMETSAKTSENTSNALETIARDALIMTINTSMTQKELLEREQRLDGGKLNKDNCTIS
ncbi:Aste57867_18686 [Aphanomyces stellatus]|uniref:Aste57867_18686 protein n=1 Tax=Aphanomyces stellatus TaxID=120398 RepID=A0A485LB47_9STRA|nr:hypothetical protein As57867_018624 [Aphanomyces stellatus]VFT95421.1 Aste57867_18686 [Aphanomyces stellatus]